MSSASKSRSVSRRRIPSPYIANKHLLELEQATAVEVVAEDMAVVKVKEALALLVKEMEEDLMEEEEEVEKEPLWQMSLTLLMSLDPSLTKNGELSQVRTNDTSTKSASALAQTKELLQEKSPQ